MLHHALLLLGLLAAAPAAEGSATVEPHDAWREHIGTAGLDADQVLYPFALTPEMEAWASEATDGARQPLERLDRLQRALFDDRGFAYERGATLTAEQAFAERRGNCLAFTALFVALARSVDVEARLVTVERVLDAQREDDLVVLSRHVVAGVRYMGTLYLYDFAESSEYAWWEVSEVDDAAASAMFHANLGAAALRARHYERAARQLGLATDLRPDHLAAWVNLGVARRHLGDPEGAIDAYERALGLDPRNPWALTNLAAVWQALGRHDEAQDALRAASRDVRDSPYLLVARADLERAGGQTDEAWRLLRRARRHHPGHPDVLDAMARWAEATDHPRKAARWSRRADRKR